MLMWILLLVLLSLSPSSLHAAIARLASPVCKEGSETDCSLNGVCNSEGVCVCDPGWKGDKCNQLRLKPPNKEEPYGYYNASMPTWGGDVIYEKGVYHAFLTAKGYNTPPYDGSDSYYCNTAIVRLEGTSPAGPFKFAEVVLPVYHHETHAIKAPDGTILIYMIKYDGAGHVPDLLSDACLEPVCHNFNISHNVIAMAWSKSVYGPWEEKVILDPWPGPTNRTSWLCQTNCPSVTFAPNGTAIMALRSVQCDESNPNDDTKEKIAIATAPHWSGPYSIRSAEPVFGWYTPDDWPTSLVYPAGQIMHNEDPFIWRTKRGYHMLVHCQLNPGHSTRGAYGYSKDGLSWTLLPDLMWDVNMTWSDGSVSYFKRRQAPDLYLDTNGYPLYLLTPVDEIYENGCHWGNGWTLIQSIEHQ